MSQTSMNIFWFATKYETKHLQYNKDIHKRKKTRH
jgi:hypothetical protein